MEEGQLSGSHQCHRAFGPRKTALYVDRRVELLSPYGLTGAGTNACTFSWTSLQRDTSAPSLQSRQLILLHRRAIYVGPGGSNTSTTGATISIIDLDRSGAKRLPS
jgi:hypothetical protein